MNARSVRTCAALSAVASLATGCFSYVPVELGSVPEGESVRVQLSRQALVDLEEIPVEDGTRVTGTFVREEGEGMLLRVPVATRQEGFFFSAIEQEVPIPATGILMLEQRRLDRGRTALFVGGTAAVAAFVIQMIIGGSEGGVEGEGPGIEETRIPLLVVPLGR